MERHLWLVGMMGSGKTATARTLAQRLGTAVIDTDAEVARRTGCSIAQLWGERGEEAFRDMESATIARVAGDEAGAVVATGGGAVLSDDNVAAMRRRGAVVWLSGSPETLAQRVGDGSGRPLLERGATPSDLARILFERKDRYAGAADLIVVTDGVTVGGTADRIEAWWTS